MTEEDADRLQAQMEQMTWAQLMALWKWITLYAFEVRKGK